VARKYDPWIENALRAANDGANPGLFRIAHKMATGAGKTVVMGMLIAWHALNKLANAKGRPLFRRVSDCGAGHHDPRPAACAAAHRPQQLLSPA
jgi:hypothetical protein